MALNQALLKQQIKAAFDTAKQQTENPDAVIDKLAGDIAAAVHAYVSAAQVPAGIPVATAGTATAQTGATTAPVTLV